MCGCEVFGFEAVLGVTFMVVVPLPGNYMDQ